MTTTEKKRLCIINTGGTIAMRPGPRGLEAAPGFLEKQMAAMPELRDPSMPEYEIVEYDPVLDSSNLTPEDWVKIAREIQAHYHQFDGFVVLHGTDTMAYTASALPLMLGGLNKSVILTGSQLPLSMLRNDARENLITTMMLASQYRIPEVCLFFGGRLLRGCRATKMSTSSFEAFDSPNYPPLGIAATHITVYRDRILQEVNRSDELTIHRIRTAQVATFRLFPGLSVDVLRNVMQKPLRGIVLEAYGVGNGPSRNRPFLEALQNATHEGVVIVNCTQCRFGSVSQNEYATGTALRDVGVVPGHDMTIEAALAKLQFLFSQDYDSDEVRHKIQQNLVGELTES